MSDLTAWIHDNKEILIVTGPYISALMSAAAITVTALATIGVTRSIKKTETVAQYGQSFMALMEARDRLKNRSVGDGSTNLQLAQEAKDYYGQLFSFLFSEFYAYKSGYVDSRVFLLWMNSRRKEYEAGEKGRSLHGVSYKDGWKYWLEEWHHHDPSSPDPFVTFMDKVHKSSIPIKTLLRR